MPPPRPNGTPPHDFLVDFRQFFNFDWPESVRVGKPLQSPTEAITVKCDGFQVKVALRKDVIAEKDGTLHEKTVQIIITKNGHLYENAFKAPLHEIIKSRIGHIEYGQIHHRYAGDVTALYGELYVLTDGVHNLKMLMDRQHMRILPGDMIFRLNFFDCDFKNPGVNVPIAEKLDLMGGFIPVVQTLFDERDMLTVKTHEEAELYGEKVLHGIETFLNDGGEGIVAVIKTGKTLAGRRTIKHKPQRPVQLYIVAVIFEEKDGTKIPSKFAWAVRHSEKLYSIIHIDEKGILCDPARKEQGKRYIPPSSFEKNNKGIYTITETGYAADSYNAVLRGIGNNFRKDGVMFKKETAVVNKKGLGRTTEASQTDQVTVNGITYHIAPNRKFLDMKKEYHFLHAPLKIVAGCNKLWLNAHIAGDIHALAAAVHLQAGLVLATSDYGKEIHRDLLEMNMGVETLVSMAQTHNLQKHADLLAECRYGKGTKYCIDLVVGHVDKTDNEDDTTDRECDTHEETSDSADDEEENETVDKAAKRRKIQMYDD